MSPLIDQILYRWWWLLLAHNPKRNYTGYQPNICSRRRRQPGLRWHILRIFNSFSHLPYVHICECISACLPKLIVKMFAFLRTIEHWTARTLKKTTNTEQLSKLKPTRKTVVAVQIRTYILKFNVTVACLTWTIICFFIYISTSFTFKYQFAAATKYHWIVWPILLVYFAKENVTWPNLLNIVYYIYFFLMQYIWTKYIENLLPAFFGLWLLVAWYWTEFTSMSIFFNISISI